jgi:hypothetical protein
MFLWLLIILGKVQSMQPFLLFSTSRRIETSARNFSRISNTNVVNSFSQQYAKKHDDNEDYHVGGVMIRDTMAITVAYELIGLIDTLNDSSFWILGGIPLVPLTLATFVQRTALSCLCWILSNTFISNPINVEKLWKVISTFLLFQFALSFVVNQVTVGAQYDPWFELRDCYVTLSVIFGWRYLFRKYL